MNADGIRDTNYLRNRDINPNCGAAEAHSTAHVENSARDKFVEVGWHETETFIGNKIWNIFWEVIIGSTRIGDLGNGPTVDCCAWVEFKIESVPGTLRWKFYYDYGNNGGYRQVGPDDGVGANFGEGILMGETARRGGNATGAADEHQGLKRKVCSSCDYNFWQNQFQAHPNEITNWHYVKVNDHHYEVKKDA